MSDYTSNTSRPASPIADLPDMLPAAASAHARPYRFTFDAARRGPASVSETTEGGRGPGDYFGVSPRVDLFGVAATALDIPSEWSSSKHGFHAISTVLNNPHKKQAPPKAHSALPSAPPADLPRVRRKDFGSYLRAVAPEWDRYQHNAQLGREGSAQLDPSDDPPRALPPGRAIPPLAVVPRVFFDPAFALGDPRTFNAVTEQADDDADADPSALAHALPLLERLSHYADTIEQHLIQEISLRSTAFFAALANLHDLRAESAECLDRIAHLRALLAEVDEGGAKKGLAVIRRDARVRNVRRVREGVREVGAVVDVTGVARGLVGAGRWGDALDVIEEMEALWKAEPAPVPAPTTATPTRTRSPLPPTPESPPESPPSSLPESPRRPSIPSLSVPLSALHAFAHLPSHLTALTSEIAAALTAELVTLLHADLLARIQFHTSKAEGKGGEGEGSGEKEKEKEEALKDRLRPLLHGLARAGGVREAVGAWREAVLAEVRAAVTRHIPVLEIEEEGKAGAGAGALRAMEQATFMDLLRAMYASLLGCVEGLQAQNAIIVEVVGSLPPPAAAPAPALAALQDALADVLASAAELSNAQAARVVGLRAEQHAALGLPGFLAFFGASWAFVVGCEVVCRRMIVGLRGAVVGQSKVFLQTFHQARISQSAKLVEDEQWNPVEVPPALQRVTDVLVDAAIRDPPDLLLSSPGSPPTPAAPAPAPPSSPPPSRGPASPPPSPSNSRSKSSSAAKHVRIEDRTYFTVSATAAVLGLLVDYLKVVVNLPMLATDTMGRTIEFLKAFNSRTCQVVLGAGAMRSAGLKNITAKHLALASQSLSIMIALIPYVRETFRRHLSTKQAVMLVEFDKLKRDYQEHQNEIHAKLIAIMGDRLSIHIKSLEVVNWAAPRDASAGVNGYMEILVKETVTLHKVLSRYLSIPVVEYVMTQVSAAMNHRLSEEYATIELPNQEAKDRMLADARYLHQKFSMLKNVGTPSSMLETVIKEKSVARAANAASPQPAAPPPQPRTANERIKNMLARKDSIFSSGANTEKSLPTPTPPLPPPSAINGFGSSPGLNGSNASLLGTPSSRPGTPTGNAGFNSTARRVSGPIRPESPLPALPIGAVAATDAPGVASSPPLMDGQPLQPANRPPRSSSLDPSREGAASPAPAPLAAAAPSPESS